jgi:hypothetical protein
MSRPSTPRLLRCREDVDARDKRGHDGVGLRLPPEILGNAIIQGEAGRRAAAAARGATVPGAQRAHRIVAVVELAADDAAAIAPALMRSGRRVARKLGQPGRITRPRDTLIRARGGGRPGQNRPGDNHRERRAGSARATHRCPETLRHGVHPRPILSWEPILAPAHRRPEGFNHFFAPDPSRRPCWRASADALRRPCVHHLAVRRKESPGIPLWIGKYSANTPRPARSPPAGPLRAVQSVRTKGDFCRVWKICHHESGSALLILPREDKNLLDSGWA